VISAPALVKHATRHLVNVVLSPDRTAFVAPQYTLTRAAGSVKIARQAQAVNNAEPCASFKVTILLLRCMAASACLNGQQFWVPSPDKLAMTGLS
jgi:hypothetical protein